MDKWYAPYTRNSLINILNESTCATLSELQVMIVFIYIILTTNQDKSFMKINYNIIKIQFF